jgi:hypothetical protein
MPTQFSSATAEQVISVVEACVATGKPINPEYASRFCDLQNPAAEAALMLAVDIGYLKRSGADFSVGSPLARLAAHPSGESRAASLRVLLEAYEPFTVFRSRLINASLNEAARQTATILDLSAHQAEIKDTLISLGTYARALTSEGGGNYEPTTEPFDLIAARVLDVSEDLASAEASTRSLLSADTAEWVSRDDVLLPLADAFVTARAEPRLAVVSAGNAVDSYLQAVAASQGVTLTSTGINGHLDQLRASANLPKKLQHAGKLLGHVRNAADHGVDPELGTGWTISDEMGEIYPILACVHIRAVDSWRRGNPPTI